MHNLWFMYIYYICRLNDSIIKANKIYFCQRKNLPNSEYSAVWSITKYCGADFWKNFTISPSVRLLISNFVRQLFNGASGGCDWSNSWTPIMFIQWFFCVSFNIQLIINLSRFECFLPTHTQLVLILIIAEQSLFVTTNFDVGVHKNKTKKENCCSRTLLFFCSVTKKFTSNKQLTTTTANIEKYLFFGEKRWRRRWKLYKIKRKLFSKKKIQGSR